VPHKPYTCARFVAEAGEGKTSTALAALPNLSAQIEGVEWIILLVILAGLFLFGPQKIPELARAIGRAWGELQRGRMEIEREIRRELAEPPAEEIATPIERAAASLGLPKGRGDTDLRLAIARALDRATEGQLSAAAQALRVYRMGAPAEELRKAILDAIAR